MRYEVTSAAQIHPPSGDAFATPGSAPCPDVARIVGRVPDESLLRSELDGLGRGQDIASVRPLSGGSAADPWLVSYADGRRVVGKTLAGAPGVFLTEAEGLSALRASGYVRTPEVLAVTGRLLLMEELPAREDTEASWTAFAAELAGPHRHSISDRFGTASGGLSIIDPAASHTWAEVDLSMLWSYPRPPASDRFFHVYQELNPSPAGWAERMPLLNLRELLSVTAHETESAWAVGRIRATLRPFYLN